ncbi:MAG: hypothetical protein NVSMB26_00010 [Beijerinckiaceae bacterium]
MLLATFALFTTVGLVCGFILRFPAFFVLLVAVIAVSSWMAWSPEAPATNLFMFLVSSGGAQLGYFVAILVRTLGRSRIGPSVGKVPDQSGSVRNKPVAR